MAEEKQQYRADNYHESFDPSKLKDADLNISQYWDDSSMKNYNDPNRWWGENAKYEWEATKNSQVAYNPNATVEWLDPNYKYGQEAQMANSEEAWYIARRNDEIASALYNAWKTSQLDVADFLNSQQWFYNSNTEERHNTVQSIWKRLGQMVEQNKQSDTKSVEPANTPQDTDNEALSNMESDLNKSTAGELYGKVTAEEWNPQNWINTLEDANSIYRQMDAKRIETFKDLQAMDSQSIAAAIVSGAMASDTQAMRDLMQYDPAKYQEVKQAEKRLIGQKNINAIANGEYSALSEINAKQQGIESEKNTLADSVANSETDAAEILKSLDESLASNTAATTAEQTMANLTADINKLNTRLKNLKNEAKSVFKWDVPQYIVQAYISNRTAEIQDKLQELQYNYDAAYNRYQTELNNSWKEKEYQITLRNMKLQEDKFAYEKQKDQIKNNEIVRKDGDAYQINYTENGIIISKATIMQQYAESWMKWQWLKNNNPWNIKDTQFGNVIGTWANWFAQFATPEDWFDALVEKIKYNQTNSKSRYYGKTIREYFQLYAPSSDGNNPDSYANSVAKQLGVSVDTPISQLDPIKFAAQIAKHDSGYDYSTYGQFRKWSLWSQTYFDESSISIPNSIYDTWYKTVDPNSDEWKKLREEYISKMKQEMQTSGWLVADADWKDTAAYQVISDDDVTPISFRQRIYNLVPATLKNSDMELKNLYNTAKDLYVAWYSPDEAAMVFYGIDPRNDNSWLLKPLIYTARASGKKLDESFYGNLWSLLDAGNTKQAIRLVENNILSDKDKEQEATAMSVIRKIQDLEKKLEWAEDVVWPFQWTVADWTNKYIKWWGQDGQIAADIANIYSQIRKELMGANVTETELKANEWLFPSTKDKMANIVVKLNATKTSLLNDVNATRVLYDLPELDEYSLVDLGMRAYLYNGIDTSSMDVKTTTNWGN